MKLISQSPGLRDFTVNEGRVIRTGRDGFFHTSDALGKSLVKSGEFTSVGINLRSAQGWRCTDCGRVNVYRDHCGKCDGHNLELADD